MGRVDEAMRRAAEGALAKSLDRPSGAGAVSPDTGEPDGRPDARPEFPSEVPQGRARLTTVSPVASLTGGADSIAADSGPTSGLIPDLASQIDARLQHKVVIDRDMDPASREQYRRLAAGLHAAQATSGLKVVMMASAVAGEGKSLTSSNLALTFSESYNRQVLLIDGDLRRPSLHTVFGLPASPGLSEGLAHANDGQLSLHRVSSRLSVLTAGQSTSDPMGALVSNRMARLVDEARQAFDWVVVDTPPIGLLSDASLLSQMVDGAILVVKAGSTPYDLVQRAIVALGRDRILGVVLNRADAPNAAGYKYHAYYSVPGVSSGR